MLGTNIIRPITYQLKNISHPSHWVAIGMNDQHVLSLNSVLIKSNPFSYKLEQFS